ncbi:MAG: EF-hand domain-containing protein [Verrucomicrobia bacterium]|nr:EF-hand domain-containing protein [Verrucomicrobiota bacterium]MBU1736086.1 EF-hand domain-containing protein [Verrucomicrobiota bacterium]MBU1855523.1 EF-hand domain-containing protein [Verrucomicrobiota bacterium]
MSQMLKWAVAGVAAVAMMSVVCAQEKAASTTATDLKAGAKIVKSIFQKMDANIDGKLTAKERQARLKEWFKELDANGDGKVSPDEFIGQRFVNIDVNKDGSVTMEEYVVFFAGADAAADQTAACDELDANGDNEVSAVEVIAYRKSVFAAMDANGDGKVTPDEMKAGADKQFKDRDANNDGFVTVEEMIAIIPIPAVPKVEEKTADQPAE